MHITNFRIEKFVKYVVNENAYYGFRIIKNQKVMELYRETKEEALAWCKEM